MPLRLFLLLSGVVSIAACSAGERLPSLVGPGVQQSDTCASNVRVTPPSAVVRYGNSLQLSATLGCGSQAAIVRWSSVDTTIAFVDSLSGLMHARTVTGTTSIIASLASDRSIQGSMVVQVTP